MSRAPRFASVVLDVDSTLCDLEGVDWLAARRDEIVAQQSAILTERAMNGEIAIDAVYAERMNLIKPTRAEMSELAQVYRQKLAEGAERAITELRAAGVRLILVSGGFRPAIAPLANDLQFRDDDIFAVDVYWNDSGKYQGFESSSPLTTQHGKRSVVGQLALPRPILAVGDGATDLDIRPVVDEFAVFTGFERREAVIKAADREIASYDQLSQYVLST